MQDGSLGLLPKVIESLMDSVAHCHPTYTMCVEAIIYTRAGMVFGGQRVWGLLGLFEYIRLGLLSRQRRDITGNICL